MAKAKALAKEEKALAKGALGKAKAKGKAKKSNLVKSNPLEKEEYLGKR